MVEKGSVAHYQGSGWEGRLVYKGQRERTQKIFELWDRDRYDVTIATEPSIVAVPD